MPAKFTNNAFGTLASSITNVATSISLSSGHGARFPSLSAGEFFYATLVDASNNLEIIQVTARSTDTLTVARGQDGTTARAYSAGDRLELRATAAVLTNMVQLDGAQTISGAKTFTGLNTHTTPTLAATASGTTAGRLGYSAGVVSYGDGTSQRSVVNTDGTQTLTNKTIGSGSTWSGNTIGVSSGGTGSTTLAANNVLLGNGTSALQSVAPGTSGNVLTSNGTTWTSAPATSGYSGSTYTQTATNITLTNTSTQYQTTSFTAADVGLILPNPANMPAEGLNVFGMYNAGPYPAYTFSHDGYKLVSMSAGSGPNFWDLADDYAGQRRWSYYGLPFGVVEASSPVVASGSTTDGGYSAYFHMQKLTATSFIAVYTCTSGTTGTAYAVAGSISGTTLTLGTPVTIVSGTSVRYVAVCALSSTLAGVAVRNGSSSRVYPISISGTTLTLGTSSAAFTASSVANGVDIVALDSTRALLLYNEAVRVVTFSGTSAPTLGTAFTTNLASTYANFAGCSVLMDTNKVVAALEETSIPNNKLFYFTTSGTTVSSATSVNGGNAQSIPPYKLTTTTFLIQNYGVYSVSTGTPVFSSSVSNFNFSPYRTGQISAYVFAGRQGYSEFSPTANSFEYFGQCGVTTNTVLQNNNTSQIIALDSTTLIGGGLSSYASGAQFNIFKIII